MPERISKVVGLEVTGNQVQRGYFSVHEVDENGQETVGPRDIQFSDAQIAAFNTALPGIMEAE
jgi:hypothetical protein